MSATPVVQPVRVVSGLRDDQAETVTGLVARLNLFSTRNRLKLAYYEGEQRVRQLGISIPPSLNKIEVVAGWAGTVVDVLEERLDWYGWRTDGTDDHGLMDVYRANALDVEASLAHLDSLIYGTSFVSVGTGFEGEPHPLVAVHSPTSMTGHWDARLRRLTAAVAVTATDEAGPSALTFYDPNVTVYLARSGGVWSVVARDEHNLGRVPVVQIENRARTDRRGRSEISKAVRSYTDQAVRTLLGMEIHREFYQAPQRWVMGAAADDFADADGNVRTGWETIMGRVWAIGRDENGDVPQVGQFQPASPTPYLEQVRGLAQLLAAEAAIPPSYLGFQTDNPASADAIQRSEARLVKRAERRQTGFGRSWLEVGRLALLVRDGSVPGDFDASVSTKWRDASTPTRSAAADEATKLIAAGVLLPDSSVTYDRVGLDPDEQAQLDADKRRAAGSTVLDRLREVTAGGTGDAAV